MKLVLLGILTMLLAGCLGPSVGMVVYEDQATVCKVQSYHWAIGLGSNYAVVACNDKADGAHICSYNMGVDSDGHPNGTFYNCRGGKPTGAT